MYIKIIMVYTNIVFFFSFSGELIIHEYIHCYTNLSGGFVQVKVVSDLYKYAIIRSIILHMLQKCGLCVRHVYNGDYRQPVPMSASKMSRHLWN